MRVFRLISSMVVTSLLSACAAPLPAPAPEHEASAGIGVLVTTRAPIKMFSTKVDSIMFIRLEDDAVVPYLSAQPIASNYVKDDYVYLLNAPPGRYAAVASFRAQETAPPAAPPPRDGGVTVVINPEADTDYSTYFSAELIEATIVTVEPHKLVFMGEFVVDTSTAFDNADAAQAHYFRLLAPGAENRSAFRGLMSGSYHYTGALHEVKRDQVSRARFVEKSRKNLGERGWAAMID